MAIEITNHDLWAQAIANALVKIHEARLNDWETVRHTNAVAKAAAQIEANGAFMTYHAGEKSMTIWNQKTNGVYTANGVCECEAFKRGYICFHRAAARLWTRYCELLKAADDAALEKAAKLTEFSARLNELPKVADGRAATLPEILEAGNEPKSLHERNKIQSAAPYLKATSDKKPEKLGNIRI